MASYVLRHREFWDKFNTDLNSIDNTNVVIEYDFMKNISKYFTIFQSCR